MGNLDVVKQVEDGVDYHVFCMKKTDYVMNIMTTYGAFETTYKKTRRKFKHGGVMETKEFMYKEVVANNSLYQHQVDENNNRRHAHISIERTWDTKYWPDNCFAWYLAISEVNTNYTQTYFQDSSNAPPILNPGEYRQRSSWKTPLVDTGYCSRFQVEITSTWNLLD